MYFPNVFQIISEFSCNGILHLNSQLPSLFTKRIKKAAQIPDGEVSNEVPKSLHSEAATLRWWAAAGCGPLGDSSEPALAVREEAPNGVAWALHI